MILFISWRIWNSSTSEWRSEKCFFTTKYPWQKLFINTHAEFCFAKRMEVCIIGKDGAHKAKKIHSIQCKTNWQVSTIQPACNIVHQQQNVEKRMYSGPKVRTTMKFLVLLSRSHVAWKGLFNIKDAREATSPIIDPFPLEDQSSNIKASVSWSVFFKVKG